MIHQLKMEKEYFDKMEDGKKLWEVRKNDRDFHVGDYLGLNEIAEDPTDPSAGCKETGRSILVNVVDVFSDDRFLKDGYVILSLEMCHIMQFSKASPSVI